MSKGVIAVLISVISLVPALVFAQAFPVDNLIPDVTVRGQGWSQVRNLAEVREFLLALIEMTVLTAAIIFHPSTWTAQKSAAHYHLVHKKFLFGLIGLIIGFLVVHHGYLIGFVIFGLGGLMRFRIETDDEADVTHLIVVALIGLCVGLDLPVMALILAASTWVIIYFAGGRARSVLSVRFDEHKFAPSDIAALAETLRVAGIKVIATSKSRFKPAAEFVLHAGPQGQQTIERLMEEQRGRDQSVLKDWHIE